MLLMNSTVFKRAIAQGLAPASLTPEGFKKMDWWGKDKAINPEWYLDVVDKYAVHCGGIACRVDPGNGYRSHMAIAFEGDIALGKYICRQGKWEEVDQKELCSLIEAAKALNYAIAYSHFDGLNFDFTESHKHNKIVDIPEHDAKVYLSEISTDPVLLLRDSQIVGVIYGYYNGNNSREFLASPTPEIEDMYDALRSKTAHHQEIRP